MTDARASNWSVTINNPSVCDEENIGIARQKGWQVEGQKERGENGTEHYQLYVNTRSQQRFSALKKAFPRAHIEVARNVMKLKEYVVKEDTRVGELPESRYPSQAQVWKWFQEYFDTYKPSGDGIDDEEMLYIFDKMIHQKIREGYYVELMAVNPQIRSVIKMFGRSIVARERKFALSPQTDRQTDTLNSHEIKSLSIDINHASQIDEIGEKTPQGLRSDERKDDAQTSSGKTFSTCSSGSD